MNVKNTVALGIGLVLAASGVSAAGCERAGVAALLGELLQEAETTRRVLERVPADKLDWKPHPRSRSLGALALHVARLPGDVPGFLADDTFETASLDFSGPQPASKAVIHTDFAAALATARAYLEGACDADVMKTWTLLRHGKPLLSMPRFGVLRAFMLNHLYHHRGQLTVYLRLLEVPVPSVYGPSADEKPAFARPAG